MQICLGFYVELFHDFKISNLDADDEFDQASPRKGRGMSMEYSKVANLTDYNGAKEYMGDSMPEYKFRLNTETKDGRKCYYNSCGFLKCPKWST